MRKIALTAVILLAIAPVAVTGLQVNAAVSDVTLSPGTPAPGETVTFTVDIQNFESSGDPLAINSVAIRSADDDSGITEHTRVRQLGTLSPGSTISLDLRAAFETAGTKDLRVHVYGENADTNENVELRYPVSVTVEERHPQMEIQSNDSTAGVATNGTVTMANGLDANLTTAEMSVTSEDVTMLDSETVFADVDSGSTVTVPYRYRAESAGTHELQATLSYTLPGGTQRSVTQNRTVETEPLDDGVVVAASSNGTGSEQQLRVDVLNQGNTAAEDVVVRADSENATVGQTIISSVPAGSSRQVRLESTLSEPRAGVTVTAEYEVGSEERSTTTTATLESVPAAIELTGVSVVREDGLLRISGSSSNVGMTPAEGVVVRVVSTDSVDPAAPNRDFFIGDVPAGDFSSFDLTARTAGNVSAIPVEVSYLVDGERRTQTFEVANTNSTAQSQQESGSPGPPVGLLAVAVVTIVALLGGTATMIRRYRRGSATEV